MLFHRRSVSLPPSSLHRLLSSRPIPTNTTNMAPEPFNLEITPVDQYSQIISELRETFNSGLTRDLAYRKKQLRRAWEFLDENVDAIAKALYLDLRKPMQEVLGTEIAPCKEELLHFINNLDRLAKPEPVKGRYLINVMEKKYIRKDPLGVTLIMSAWNYPIQLVFLPLAGALATGNVAIIKPAELSPHTAAVLAEILPRYLDPRSYRVINAGIPETTSLLTHRFDLIFYTGNGQVAKIILAAASKYLTPVMLELGGKSPAIVMPDSDIQLTANRIGFGRWLNSGQICVCPDYALVHESVVEPFIAALKKSSERFYGEDPQKSEYYARIVNERHFNRLTKMLDSTTGRVVVGGQHNKEDLFFAPTVVTGFTDIENEPFMQHEIFGPILPIIPVSDVEEAIRFVNNRDKPLALYLFTNNKKTIDQVLDNTHSGGVTVNDTLMHVQELNMTFGGIGPSGMGKYHGDSSYDVFTHRRAIMVKKQNLEELGGAVKYPPYSQASVEILTLFTSSVPSWKGISAQFSATMTGLMAIVRLIMGVKD